VTALRRSRKRKRASARDSPAALRRIPFMKRSAPQVSRRKATAIVGPGRVGQAMGKLLNRAGFPIRFVAARRIAAARRAVQFIAGGRAVTLDSPELSDARVFLLTTSDAALEPVARQLVSSVKDWKGKIALHTSGSLPSSVLAPLRRRGAAVGSLHPYQTIPNPQEGTRSLVGCYWGIEGDKAARRLAERWVKALSGFAFPIRADKKTLYHLSAFLTCPAIVTLMDGSAKLLSKSGVPAGIARPMLAQFVAETARNFETLGARRALTGPAARGDWATLRAHLRGLKRSDPGMAPLYGALVRRMLRLAGRRAPKDLQKVLR
jgi:predicted short-subunit dehydrogenase-like oxidoreductase (DUF2520 family)